jgi:iron complex outermembrane receptor protein
LLISILPGGLSVSAKTAMEGMLNLGRITAAVTSLAFSAMSSAWADDQSVPKPIEPEDKLTEVVVTGSRIRRPDLDRLQPTTVLSSEYIERGAYANVIDALNQLPAFGEPESSLLGSQSNFGVGQSFPEFFSQGSQRTLVLVDGRRFVPANAPTIFGPTASGGEQVDLDVIPTQLIDKIETIAIGGAPIYGSDAIAGTVNIILKHDYTGLDVDASAGISGLGDARRQRLRLLAGENFADDRGNIEVSAEIANSAGLTGDQRQRYAYDSAYIPSGGVGPYQYVLISNQRVGGISTMGVPLTDDGYLNFNPNFAITSPSGQTLAFNHGALAPFNPGPPDPTGVLNIGGDGLDLAKAANLLSPQERINGTILGRFSLNAHATLYSEFWYSETHSDILAAQSEYDTSLFGAAGQPNGNLILSVNNAFLSAADQATIARNLAAYAAVPGNPTQTAQFYLSRENSDIGNGGATADQNTKRVVLGVKGSIGDSAWQYDLSGNYGQTINSSIAPLINFQNFTNALNAVVGPGGTIICAPGYTTSPLPTQSSICAPFNPFGNGIASPASHAYVTDLASAVSTLTQRVFTASLAGSVLSLPAGRVKMAGGYENRLESADFEPDQFYQQGLGYSTPIGPTRGSFLTNEVFGEVLVPIVSPTMGLPGLRQLELEAAVREVDHSVAGKAATWTAGARLAPSSILQFRGNYTRAIRAPSVVEAFTPTTRGSTQAVDPCDQTQINSGPDAAVRARNCAAAGITQPFSSNIMSFDAPSTVSGDPTLRNEISDSRTFGFVLRPLPRMSLTVDYVSIDIKDVIFLQSATNVLLQCYDSPSFPNAACADFTRDSTGQLTLVKTTFANENSSSFNGVMTEFDYSFDLGFGDRPRNLGSLDVRLNHFFENRLEVTVNDSESDVFQGTLGNSKHKAAIDLTWSKDQIFALWHARYAGHAIFSNSLPPGYTQVTGVGGWWMNDLTLGLTPIPNLRLQLVVDNVFDKQPPQPLPAAPPMGGNGYATYFSGLLGRYFVLSLNYRM